MPDLRPAELRQTCSIFPSVLAAHTAAKERLMERRSTAFEAEEIAKLEVLIAQSEGIIRTVGSAAEALECQLKEMETQREQTASR